MASDQQDILDLVQYSLGRKRKTFGHGFESGYHTLELDGVVVEGQRDIATRLASMNYPFDGKAVLDIGCNIGGMLHALSSRIKYGVGIDNQYKAINAANRIASVGKENTTRFYVFDLAKDDWGILSKLCHDTYDVVLFLSMALWVPCWREVVSWSYPRDLFYESNGDWDFQDEQENYLRSVYGKVQRITDQSDDDKRTSEGSKQRRLYLCTANMNEQRLERRQIAYVGHCGVVLARLANDATLTSRRHTGQRGPSVGGVL